MAPNVMAKIIMGYVRQLELCGFCPVASLNKSSRVGIYSLWSFYRKPIIIYRLILKDPSALPNRIMEFPPSIQ